MGQAFRKRRRRWSLQELLRQQVHDEDVVSSNGGGEEDIDLVGIRVEKKTTAYSRDPHFFRTQISSSCSRGCLLVNVFLPIHIQFSLSLFCHYHFCSFFIL